MKATYFQRLFTLITVCCALLGWLASPKDVTPVYAQTTTSKPGIDVLFIVDQSGSMGGLAAGSDVHPDANDALGLRFEAPESLARLMAEDIVQIRHDEAVHRFAVVDFGDSASIRRVEPDQKAWTIVDPANWDQLNADMNTLTSAGGHLDGDRYRKSNLGNTNFLSAFDAAKVVFDELGSPAPDRVRAIVVLTDGSPCIIIQDSAPPQCQDPYAQMQQLQEKATANFPSADYAIYVVAMNDSRINYWDNFGPRWEAITGPGRANKVESNADVGVFFHDIWQELTKRLPTDVVVITEPIKPGPIIVPPFLDTISFTLFKARPEETLDVRDGANQLLTADDENVTASGENIYRLTVFRPLPGVWRVSTTGSEGNVDITMEQVVARGKLLSPIGDLAQFSPTELRWQLLDSRGNPLPDYTDDRYRLRPLITVSANGEALPDVELQLDKDSTYTASFTPCQSGLHTIVMSAVAKDAEDKEIVVFDGEVATIDVSLVSLRTTGLPEPFPQFTTQNFSLELQSASGRRASVSTSVSVSATVEAGGQQFPLRLTRASGGVFQGRFVAVNAGPHRVLASAELSDPICGVRRIENEEAGRFTVQPTLLQPAAAHSTLTQFMPTRLTYGFYSAAGEAVAVAPSTEVELAIHAGETTTNAPLRGEEDGIFAVDYAPVQNGPHTVNAVLHIRDAADASRELSLPTIDNFDVSPVTLQPTALAARWPIFVAQPITFIYQNAAAQPVAVDAGYRLDAQITAGAQTWTLPLDRTEDGHFQGAFIPTQLGAHEIAVNMVAADGSLAMASSLFVGTSNVELPQITALEPTGTLAQYRELPIRYEITGLDGAAWQLAPDHRLLLTATLTTSGAAPTVVELQPDGASQYAAQLKPTLAGAHALQVAGSVIDPDGAHYALFVDGPKSLEVAATTLLQLQLVQPLPGATQEQMVRRLAFEQPLNWFSAPNPIIVEAHLVDAQGAPVDPRLALANSDQSPFFFAVTRAADGVDVSDQFALRDSGAMGVYRVEALGLTLGQYNVNVTMRPNLSTQAAYLPAATTDPTVDSMSGVIKVVQNWTWLGLWAGIAFLALVTTGGVVAGLVRNARLSRHPVRGTLQLEDEFSRPMWTRALGGRNHIVVSGLPAITHIKRLEVRCDNDEESKNGIVHVVAHLDDGMRNPALTLRPGVGRQKLGRYNVYLKKIN